MNWGTRHDLVLFYIKCVLASAAAATAQCHVRDEYFLIIIIGDCVRRPKNVSLQLNVNENVKISIWCVRWYGAAATVWKLPYNSSVY